MLPEFLEQLEGSPYVILKNDPIHGAWAKKSKCFVKEREIFALPEVRSILQRSNIVYLDCGAFVGDTCVPFLEAGAEAWCFEPYKDAFTALCINCPAARKLNVVVGNGTRLTAAGKYGESDGNMGARMVSEGGNPSFRIDDLYLKQVDFIKVDIEGAELLMLEGAEETIKRCKPFILIEAYSQMLAAFGSTRQDLLNKLTDLGYEYRLAIGKEDEDRVDYLAKPK